MTCIVCLGNPGSSYTFTRHNVGFRIADALVDAWNFGSYKQAFHSHLYSGNVHGKKVYILKPQTFMNNSGDAVQSFQQFYKWDKSNFLIVFDDFELTFGETRFKGKGSAGTHNGLKSIVSSMQSKEIPRYRIGIGPRSSQLSVSDFVLQNFSQYQREKLNILLPKYVDAIELSIKESIQVAMNSVNNKNFLD